MWNSNGAKSSSARARETRIGSRSSPENLIRPLRDQIEKARALHNEDLDAGLGAVHPPDALAVKYPNAAKSREWQYAFPSPALSADPQTGLTRRRHLYEQTVQEAVKRAASRAGIDKTCTPHVLRHSFATRLLQDPGYDIRTVQELLRHDGVRTTMVYAHVLNRGGKGIVSPLDSL